MPSITITPDMTMEQILRVAPSAQRALFQRYHVGGCSSCGFQPSDTLARVCRDHNLLDVDDVIRTIVTAEELDERIRVEPRQVKAWLESGEDFTFLDVRSPDEIERAGVREAQPLDYTAQERYMALPKERRMVFLCQTGARSLDVAAYFIGHGFREVYSVRGGVEAWSEQVGAAAPRS